ncbi:hypothetical protein HanPSC8_Chr04g0171291 [Helianthus annuus]|nr:hypothetical protein HanPSC8_Chr04g0171291 [Helianthus annuus]
MAKSPVHLADKPRGIHEERARSKGTKFIVSLHYTLLLVLCSQF